MATIAPLRSAITPEDALRIAHDARDALDRARAALEATQERIELSRRLTESVDGPQRATQIPAPFPRAENEPAVTKGVVLRFRPSLKPATR